MNPTGYLTASYISSLDDSEQPFALWVPRTYSPKKKYPLVIALHGTDADHRMIPEECFRIHERGFHEGVILLSPFGRGDLDYQWAGEADLWEAMRWVKERYRVDPRRQYLTGLSMGGFACWRLACQYPEQWAAIAPICGGGRASDLVNLRGLPVWCVHGEKDEIVPIGHSREMIAEMRKLGYPFRYNELRGWGHNSWEWLYTPKSHKPSLVDWFLQFAKSRPAPKVAAPSRRGYFKDLFSERVIISHPGHPSIPRELAVLRSEAERLAHFTSGERVMRSGKFIMKTDEELSEDELRETNHLMIGRTENHERLRQAQRKLSARHVKGILHVGGETYLGKSLVVATVQPSPWNAAKLLGVLTYQQFLQMRGIGERLLGQEPEPLWINIYDTQQRRYIKRDMP